MERRMKNRKTQLDNFVCVSDSTTLYCLTFVQRCVNKCLPTRVRIGAVERVQGLLEHSESESGWFRQRSSSFQSH